MATEQQKALATDVAAVSLSHVERLYVQRGLDLLVSANDRLVKKETDPQFVQMREKETAMLRDLRSRFGAK